MKHTLLFSVIFTLTSLSLPGQDRTIESINSNWQFHKGEIAGFPAQSSNAGWHSISLPHSWNKEDVNDDEPGYYRGAGCYRKTITVPPGWREKDIYLHFEGSNQTTDVFVNGQKAGTHTGGYTAFNFHINKLLKEGTNEITVRTDNSHSENIPPLSADFTFFGGIYRDVYLIAVNKVHFDMDNYASAGVFISTPAVTSENAQVVVRGRSSNSSGTDRDLIIVSRIRDRKGKMVAERKISRKAPANKKVDFSQEFTIGSPHLWSPENPYLYTVQSEIRDNRTGELLDRISNPLGFRWFSFDADEGFFLNGKPYKLIGTSRHQDYKDLANALPDELQLKDVELLKEMGGNFLRVAHYPQDPVILEACDRLGILTSVEIPVVNRITETKEFYANCRNMQIEMIRQNYNHPSIIIWAYMNEVLLRPRFTDEPERKERYFKNVADLARELESLTRKEDPSRYTMIPNHGDFKLYNRVGLTRIPQLVGWNLYQGWYSGELSGFADFLDNHHRELPDKPLLVTEYGADADSRLRADKPVRFDKTVEYAVIYHQEYLKAILERPFVSAAMVWNLADFNSEERRDTDPHINNKGLLTIGRVPKNTYYFYQSHLLKEPFIRIGSRNTTLGSGIAANNNTSIVEIPVFTNQKSVTLYLNGLKIGTASPDFNIVRFSVPFVNGLNTLRAISEMNGKEYTDQTEIPFKMIASQLNNKEFSFDEINVSLGDQRFFADDARGIVWLPEKRYSPGSWGYIGGSVFTMKSKARQQYGSDKDIMGTSADPVYATQRTGLTEFRLDVPNGMYDVTLHFAELLSDKKQEELAYNLETIQSNEEAASERSFDVLINNMKVLENLSTEETLKPGRAFNSKFRIDVNANEGITVEFVPIKGEPILNAIQVKKVF